MHTCLLPGNGFGHLDSSDFVLFVQSPERKTKTRCVYSVQFLDNNNNNNKMIIIIIINYIITISIIKIYHNEALSIIKLYKDFGH